ncbi:MAG: Tetratricopeptide TPR_2 repeat protein [Candidatus Wolfebacteria bacterium GW2011_GWC1_43_10]|uniref:Tetratricopeptide TPR_2 repeat protein n=1 Tax=Candidatus Wolfebacteria bacterium GW2011_GWC1_43_10 TaxID=1619011 RepID=A0A0G1F3E8_9BACT|nr:MAG: Tetratricopeptide TPR_2 repeat protein [Candidatus Wolfebacteria bacterium GW2011_GWC1_43_10]
MKAVTRFSLLALAFVPLIIDASVFFPYITGKVMLVRLMVLLASTLFFLGFVFRQSFRKDIYRKLTILFKNPLFLSAVLFFLIYFLGTIFAVDQFRAFFGDVERGEGFLGMASFFGFFLFSLLVFEKKDWLTFFKISLLVGLVLFVNESYQWLVLGQDRPSSYTGNPIYLATYFLFVILAAIFVVSESVLIKNTFSRLWRILAWAIIPLSILGIFVTETRGVIVGLVVSVLLLLLYFIWKGKEICIWKGLSLRKLGIGLLILSVVFGCFFYLTKSSSFWQNVPGLDRLAQMNFNDATLQTRLISLGVSWNAIKPTNEGWLRFLVGWGPENFSIAYNKYYNPRYYEYESSWFDRAHNKPMDVLVMNGVLGLLVYLAIWISFFWLVVKDKRLNIRDSALLFFGVSYFVQNLFVFDSISTYIPFFFALAVLIFSTRGESSFDGDSFQKSQSEEVSSPIPNLHSLRKIVYYLLFGAVTVFFLISFVLTSLSYFQMRNYLTAIQSRDADQLLTVFKKSLTPYSYAQENIRTHFAVYMQNYNGQGEKANQLILESLAAMEDLVTYEKYNPRHFIVLGQSYLAFGRSQSSLEVVKKSEFYLAKAFELAPRRQDIRYSLSYILISQGRAEEAVNLLKETVALDPQVANSHFYLGIMLMDWGEAHWSEALKHLETALTLPGLSGDGKNPVLLKSTYSKLYDYFYKIRDTESFVTAGRRLAQIEPEKKGLLEDSVISALKGEWRKIDVE